MGASRDLSPAQRCTLLEAVAIELRGHAKFSDADLDRAVRGALSGRRADDRCRARGAAVPLFLHLNHSNVLGQCHNTTLASERSKTEYEDLRLVFRPCVRERILKGGSEGRDAV